MNTHKTEIFGNPRELKFDINAICAFEEKTASSFLEVISDTKSLTKLTVVRALLWASLLHNTSDITVEKVGQMMSQALSNGQTFESIAKALNGAILTSGLIEQENEEEATEGKK